MYNDLGWNASEKCTSTDKGVRIGLPGFASKVAYIHVCLHSRLLTFTFVYNPFLFVGFPALFPLHL
jgi:hypothetical protein